MTTQKNAIYRFYVGSNNTTKKPETKKAVRILRDNGIKGFSVVGSLGFWENSQEKSFIIEVISNEYNPFNDDRAKNLKVLLEHELKQFLVLVTKQELNIL